MEEKKNQLQYLAVEENLLRLTIELLNELPIRMSHKVQPIINALARSPRVDIAEQREHPLPEEQ